MDINILKYNLQSLWLTKNESEIYTTLLWVWKSPASAIARRTWIKRVTVYACIDTLIEKWLITWIEQWNVKLFSALDPDKLAEISRKKIEKERSKFMMSQKIIPFLQQLSGKEISKPKVSFYEWAEQLMDIFEETLHAEGEIKAFISTKKISPKLKDFLVNKYSGIRKKRGIYAKVIAPKNHITENYQKLDKEEYRTTKLANSDILKLDTEIDIFDDKVAFLWVKEEDEIWVLIKNKSIADSMRKIFDALWEKL